MLKAVVEFMSSRNFHLCRMEAFLRCRLAEEAGGRKPEFRPSLTISRQCGAGMDRIKESLVEYLGAIDESAIHGWACFDQSLVGKIIEDHRLPKSVEPYLAERGKFPIVDTLEEILRLHPSEWTLFNHSASTIRTLCRLGNSIVVGRAGNFVTSDLPNTFHVRLVGSESKRAARAAERFQISRGESLKLVEKTDHARASFVRRHAGADIGDPGSYHVVINTDNLSGDMVVRIIGDTVVEWANERQREQRDRSSRLVAAGDGNRSR
jgi:cytidylate kinase